LLLIYEVIVIITFMLRVGWRTVALLAAAAASTVLLAACGGGSDATETGSVAASESGAPRSGERPNAWNHVNSGLRADILEFGEVGTATELERATRVVRGYLVSRASGDAARACTYLSRYMLAVVTRMAKPGGASACVSGVEQLSKLSTADENKRPGQIEPIRIRRRHKRAFVIYRDSFGDLYAMLMRPERDGWKIQGFEPTRLA
jgi:hypothetical protein